MTELHEKDLKDRESLNDLDLNELIIASIFEIKGLDVVKIDIRELHDRPTDFFLLCSGQSVTQVKAIASNIAKNVKEYLKEFPSSFEGKSEGRWVLLDYFSTVVHVFHPETREFYGIEDLWSDGLITEYQDL